MTSKPSVHGYRTLAGTKPSPGLVAARRAHELERPDTCPVCDAALDRAAGVHAYLDTPDGPRCCSDCPACDCRGAS
jgi:hypothetical protein